MGLSGPSVCNVFRGLCESELDRGSRTVTWENRSPSSLLKMIEYGSPNKNELFNQLAAQPDPSSELRIRLVIYGCASLLDPYLTE